LNNKDILEDEATLLGDCNMVAGDLLYIVAENVNEQVSILPPILNKILANNLH